MLMIKKRNFLILLLVAVLIGTLFGGGLILIRDQTMIAKYDKMEQQYYEVNQRYGKLSELQSYIEENYYIPVEDAGLEEGIYKGLFFGIGDPYSSYLNKEEYEKLMLSTTGEEFFGVGVTILPGDDGYINVVSPIDDSPAAKAGIMAGDKIVKVDGKVYDAAGIDDAVSAMRGKEGTKVTVTVIRDEEEKTFELTRAEVHSQTVKSEVLSGNIGYIRISSFEERTGQDFAEQVKAMEKKDVKGLIVDLRDNPGGVVPASVEVADQLLDEGIVAYTEDRKGEKEFYKSTAGKTDLPYVLLVNGGSASASEIVASAVKDNKGGKLIGTTTYGKGIIQQIIPVNSIIKGDKSGDAVKMTIMQYFSPEGNVIQKKGVEPDIKIEVSRDDYETGTNTLPRDKDTQLQKAVELLSK